MMTENTPRCIVKYTGTATREFEGHYFLVYKKPGSTDYWTIIECVDDKEAFESRIGNTLNKKNCVVVESYNIFTVGKLNEGDFML